VTCYLVGAGPGPLDLLTLRAVDCLRRADAVFYDDLGPSARAAREFAPPGAELVPVGKRGGGGAGAPAQATINGDLVRACEGLLRDAAADGRRRAVVRLKGGCPSVFSRVSAEMQALREAGVAFELVPGVSSALAGPLLAGFPLTEGPPLPLLPGAAAAAAAPRGGDGEGAAPRRKQPGFAVLSGHGAESDASWASGLDGVGAVVVLMGGRALPAVVERLRDNAKFPPHTPAAVIRDAGGGGGAGGEEGGEGRAQRVWRAPLGEIVRATRGEDLSPCIVVVGDCCAAGGADADATATRR